MQSELCIICMEDITPPTNYTHPKLCECKVKMHIECFNKLNHYNLACPICRIKVKPKRNNRDSVYFFEALFLERPSASTFLLFLLFSFIITIFYIIPIISYDIIKNKIVAFISPRIPSWFCLRRDLQISNQSYQN